MAADTYYAWSKFNTEVNEFGQPTETVMPGEEISQKDLDISDEDWAALVESGAVSTEEYPEDLPDGMSPAEFYRAQAAEVAAGTADDDTVEAVELRMEATVDETIEAVNSGDNIEPESEEEKPAAKPAAAAAAKPAAGADTK